MFIAFHLIVVILESNFVEAAEKYNAKSWSYVSIFESTIGMPYYLNLSVGKIAIGSIFPYDKLGMGIALVEALVLRDWPPEIEPKYFPLSIYYLPYTKWNKHGLALPAIYGIITANYWPIDFRCLTFRAGITWFCAGFECGGVHFFSNSTWQFYAGINLSFGGWLGTNIKKQNQ
ncbi:MAG: hypothetical protein ACPL28_10075 [bacterium]